MAIDMKRLLRAVRNTELIITPRYEQWLLKGQNFPIPEPIARRLYELMITPPRVRSASFSASGSGKCMRAQMYGYLGAPQTDTVIDAKSMAIFNNGSWVHMKLQAAFLMAKIVDDPTHIEFGLSWGRMRTMGTMDAIGYVPMDHPKEAWRGKQFGVEIKSANSNVVRQLRIDGPGKYERQFTRYFRMSGVDLFVVFVEDQDTKETLEWVVEPNPSLIQADEKELIALNNHVNNRMIPPRLSECEKLSGTTFRFCDYGKKGGTCASLNTWDEVEDAQ